MGRKPLAEKSIRLPLTVNGRTEKVLNRLVKTGGYGNNSTDAARIIIMGHIQKLDEAQKIDIFSDTQEDTTG
ncbi:hypothetical protein [Ferrovibrio sp.]|uniref:hypothetical protein n=1 Tax=Ferrovibrio sp. TaxID=1917215 RepID=UPI0025C70ED2|nr:hypothetical protein [Ferrovibrio sp.]